eukprot:5953047-Amphidinium_carterae.1
MLEQGVMPSDVTVKVAVRVLGPRSEDIPHRSDISEPSLIHLVYSGCVEQPLALQDGVCIAVPVSIFRTFNTICGCLPIFRSVKLEIALHCLSS